MRKLFERFLAFVLTFVMLFEMVPALAYAEAGEALGNAAVSYAETLAIQGDDPVDGADAASGTADVLADGEEADGEEADGDPTIVADADDGQSLADGVADADPSGDAPEEADSGIAPIATEEPATIANTGDVVTYTYQEYAQTGTNHFGGAKYGWIDRSESFAGLKEALDASSLHVDTSKYKNKFIRLDKDATLGESATVPAGVALLVPCKDDDPGYVDGHAPNGAVNAKPAPSLYRALTVSSGATLSIEGTMLVNAVVGVPNTTTYDQTISGGYGQLNLEGTVSVRSGGTFDSQGKTVGSGTVVAESGSTVRDLFAVKNWRGGSYGLAMNDINVYPINEYGSHTIESAMRINSGAVYEPSVVIYTDKVSFISAQFNHANFKQVGPSDALIALHEGAYAEKTFDAATGKETYTIRGGADFKGSSLKLNIAGNLISMTLKTSTFIYPWPGTYDFNLHDGTYGFTESFKFLPGAHVNAYGATVDVASGKSLVFCDETWKDPYSNKRYASGTGAATLTLDGSSELVNNGSLAGTVNLAGDSVKPGSAAATWGDGTTTVAVDEAVSVTGSGITAKGTKQTQYFALKLNRPDYTYTIDPATKEIVWSGAKTDVLKAALDAAKAITDPAPYTEGTWSALQTAIKGAEALLAGELGTGMQGKVDAAAKALTDATSGLAKKSLAVTFDADGGTVEGGSLAERFVTYGESVSPWPTEPTRPGYKFDGWFVNGAGNKVVRLENVTAATRLVARWKPIAYTISYELGNGQTRPYSTYNASTGFTVEEPGERTGYDFTGWKVTGDVAESVAMVEGNVVPKGAYGDLTFTATWKAKTVKVTYQVNADEGEALLFNGHELDVPTYTVDATFDEPFGPMPTATKLGFTYSDWEFTADDGKKNIVNKDSVVKVDHDVTLTPEWTRDNYKIEYRLDDGTWPEGTNAPASSYTVDTPSFELPTPMRPGYTFLGWQRNSNAELENPARVETGTTGTLIFTAKWRLATYTVTLDPAEGTFAGSGVGANLARTVEHGATLGNLPALERVGFELAGWVSVDEPGQAPIDTAALTARAVTADAAYRAVWKAIPYTLTYELEGGDWAAESAPQTHPATYTVEDRVELAKPVKTGHDFTDWKVEGASAYRVEGGVIPAGTTGELAFSATWKPSTYTITWNLWEGKDPIVQKVTFGSAVTALSPERPGYRFDGWKLAGGEAADGTVVPQTMPARDLAFEATWTSYLTILEGLTASAEGLRDEETLATARDIYNNKLNAEQKDRYDTAVLFEAIRQRQEAQMRDAVDEKLPIVNGTLSPEETGTIATLSFNGTTEDGLQIVDVELMQPDYLALGMLNLPFLEELFNFEGIQEEVFINGVRTSNNQIALMEEVAWATLGERSDVSRENFMVDWLVPQKDTLTVGALSGTSVSARIMGAPTTEGVSASLGFMVRFFSHGHDVEWEEFRQISFDSQGGSPVQTIDQKVGSVVAKPANPTRTGYVFSGWYANEACEGEPYVFAYMPGTSITLYAKWTPITYGIRFAPGKAGSASVEGELPAAVDGLAYDAQTRLPGCDIEVSGYRFGGWKLDGDPTGTVYAAGTLVSKLAARQGAIATLTAQWKANAYNVTLDPGEGAVLPDGMDASITVSFDAAYGKAPELAGEGLPTPTKYGYAFAGWKIQETGAPVSNNTIVSLAKDHTLVASWNVTGDTPYRVITRTQRTDGTYEEATAELTAAADTIVEASPAAPKGFHLNEGESHLKDMLVASPDGQAVTTLTITYDRDRHTVTWVIEGAEAQPEPTEFLYGQKAEYRGQNAWEDESSHRELSGWGFATADGSEPERLETLPEVTGDLTLHAVLAKTYEAETPDGATTWRTLEIAMRRAPELLDGLVAESAITGEGEGANPALGADPVSGEPRVIVSLHGKAAADGAMEAVSVPAEGLTVPEKVMLLLPYTEGDTGYHPEMNNNQGIPGPPVNPTTTGKKDPVAHSTLAVPSGATLTVHGTVLVNALVGRNAGGTNVQDVTGGWGQISLGAGAKVVVEAGGTLDVHGFVNGSGTVVAADGGTVGDLYVVQHWRGGSHAGEMFWRGIYPMNETDCRNIEVPLTIEDGGRLDGLVTMNAYSAYYSTRFPQVDAENGLIRLKSGSSATRTLVTRGGETCERWEVTGGADFSRSTLYIIELTLSTGSFLFPIDGDTDWILKDGDYRFTEDFKFMPGALIEARNARLTVASGKTVVLYEPFGDVKNTGDTQYPDYRPAAKLTLDKDSSLVNAGTFAGNVTTVGPNVRHAGFDVGWSAITEEANGFYKDKNYDTLLRPVPHGLSITCAGHDYEISVRGEILWDGAESEFHPDEELQGAAGSAADDAATLPSLDGMELVSKPEEDGSITWTIDVTDAERAAKPAVATAEDTVTALLKSLRKAGTFASVEAQGKPKSAVKLENEPNGYDVRNLTEALGLVAGAQANVLAQPQGTAAAQAATDVEATGRDLAGVSARVIARGSGHYAGSELAITLAFTCSAPEPPAPEDPYEGLIAVYRLYNPNTGEHLLTPDANEYDELARLGWKQEGIKSWQPEAELDDATALPLAVGEAEGQAKRTLVYRLYNANNGDHLYTAKENEVNDLVKLGWKFEGAIFASADDGAAGSAPVYRLYNPNIAKNGSAGSHLYTADENEYRTLDTLGWKQEGKYWSAAALPGA